MYQGGTFLRQIWKHKPKQWGPWKAVHMALFHNAEKMDINPAKIILAMPMWEKAGKIVHNYGNDASNGTFSAGAEPSWDNTGIEFSGLDTIDVTLGDFQPDFTAIFRYNISIYDAASNWLFYHYPSTDDRIYYYLDGSVGDYIPYVRLANDVDKAGTTIAGNDIINKLVSSGFSYDSLGNLSFNFNGSITNTTTYLTSGFDSFGAGQFGYSFGSTTSLDTALFFSSVLSENQLSLLQDNPWQLWQPVPQIFFSIPATGGLTVSAAGIVPAMSGSLTRKASFHRSIGGII